VLADAAPADAANIVTAANAAVIIEVFIGSFPRKVFRSATVMWNSQGTIRI
jgi:hypothetical protein